MSNEQRDNSGALFKNTKKEQPNQPDYDGTVLVGGVEYRIAAWLKTANSGVKFMSLSFTPKRADAAPPQRDKAETWKAGAPGFRGDVDSDIPF
jgi:hypothetical protein